MSLSRRAKIFLLAIVIVILVSISIAIPLSLRDYYDREEEEVFRHAAVTSNSRECAAIGRDVLLKNGTVADAAIATLFCEGVTCAQSMGLGGGFLLTMYRKSDGMVRVLDARETAAAAAHEDMFHGGEISTTVGGLSVAVPGEIRGYESLHREYGSLPWSELIQPTIDLCRCGYEVTEYFARALHDREDIILNEPSLSEIFVNPETGKLWKKGDLVKRPKLAETLEIIAKEGGDALYNGTLTDGLVADIARYNGIITAQDLYNYKPTWHDPISVDLGSRMSLYTTPLPGSGHILSFILNCLKDWAFTPNDGLDGDNIQRWQRVIETFKYAYAKRTSLGDPEYLPLSYIAPILANLTSTKYSQYIRELIKDDITHNDWEYYGAKFDPIEDHGTAHISVLAPNGDAISVTSTVNFILGAMFRSQSTGIILNNEMDDFSYPNITSVYGMPPSPANFVRPGKRPLSSMVPSVVVEEGKGVRMIVGAAGGTKITTQVALVILKHLISNIPLKEAMDEPRLHHQLFPMQIQYEEDFDQEILEGLEKIGHETSKLSPTAGFAALTAISVDFDTGIITPKSDKRRLGSVAGF